MQNTKPVPVSVTVNLPGTPSYKAARQARKDYQRLDESDPVEQRARIDFDPGEKS
jgi:hypothetical protein